MTEKRSLKRKPISLYPLKFKDVMADVMKVKPEPKAQKPEKPKK